MSKILLCILLGFVGCIHAATPGAQFPPLPEMNPTYKIATDTLDAGGRRGVSSSYVNLGHIGGIVDTVTAPTSTNYSAQYGYLAQIILGPVITSPVRDKHYVNTSYSYQIRSSPAATGFSATGLPAWATLDAVTGVISGTTPDSAGTISFIVSATTPSGATQATVSLEILPEPPTLPTQIVYGVVGVPLEYQIRASGLGGISFAVNPLPPGLLQSGTVISGTPTQAVTLTSTLTATHTGVVSNTAQQVIAQLQIVIQPSGAPFIQSALEQAAFLGKPFSYAITATGNEPLSYSVGTLPAGLSFSNTTKQITGNATVSGVFDIPISVGNALSMDSQTLRISILEPGVPIIQRPFAISANINTAISGGSFTITDIVGGTKVTGSSGLPAGTTLTGTEITGTPTRSGLFPTIIKAYNDLGEVDFVFAQVRVKPVELLVFASDITISRNPVQTTTDVTFTPIITPAGNEALITAYSWAFYDQAGVLRFGPFAANGAGGALTTQFPTEGDFFVTIEVGAENKKTTTVKNFYVLPLAPITGVTEENITVGTSIENPVDGIRMDVESSTGGVLSLGLSTTQGALSRADESFETRLPTRVAKKNTAIAGSTPDDRANDRFRAPKTSEKFNNKGIFVFKTVTTDPNGETGRKARRMIPVGSREVGEALGTESGPVEVPSKSTRMQLDKAKPNGKFNFGKKTDKLTFSCTLTMPAGIDMSQEQTISVGMGNVYADILVDGKGKGATTQASLEGVSVTFSKFSIKVKGVTKKEPVTKAGQIATIKFTVEGNDLSKAGFDTEGITVDSVEPKATEQRQIQTGFVIGGVTYFTQLMVDYKVNNEVGQIKAVRVAR